MTEKEFKKADKVSWNSTQGTRNRHREEKTDSAN